MSVKKITAILTVFVLLITIATPAVATPVSAANFVPVQLGVDENTSETNIANYELVAENNSLAMFADTEKGWFAVRNNKTGYIWYSHPNNGLTDTVTVGLNKQNFQSEIIVNYVYTDESEGTSSYIEGSVNSQTGALRNNSVSVEKIKNGIKVTYDFYGIAARIPVTYTIEDNVLRASIIGKEVLEREKFYNAVKDTATEDNLTMIQYSYITSVWLLPTFGAGINGDKGFVFVPDGSGAYMNYTSATYSTEVFSANVYSKELAIDEYKVKNEEFASVLKDVNVRMPIFGAVNGGNAFFSVITKGDAIAQIMSYKAGITNAYTGVSSSVKFREVTSNNINGRMVQAVSNIYDILPDYEVSYTFLSGDKASWIGLAECYREYLEENKMLSKQEFTPSVAIKTIGAIDVDSSFLGIPCKKIMPLTTFEDMTAILKELENDGIKNVAVNYIGWANNGVSNKKMIKKAKALGKLGGNDELKSLTDYIEANGDTLYLDADLIFFQKSGNGVSKNSDAVQTVFGKASLQRKFTYSTFVYENTGMRVLAPQKLENVFSRYLKSTDKQLQDSAGLSFNTIAQYCYSNLNSKEGFDRISLVELYNKMLSSVERNMSAESANSYMWQYSDRIYDAPQSSSRQIIYDGEVPFYQLVTHGYVALTSSYLNHNSNKRAAILRMIETGSEPAYLCMAEDSSVVNSTDYDEFYSSNYKLWYDDLKSIYKEYYVLLEKIFDKVIVGYSQITSDITVTTYENGISVYVNYSNTDYYVNDIIVPAEGFYVKEETL